MGTRCLTVIIDDWGKEICAIYRQYDGMPQGHGKELKEFLKEFKIVQGMSGDVKLGEVANTMSCLTAQIIKHFKDCVGMFYIYPAGTRDCGECYVYTVLLKDGELNLEVHWTTNNRKLYEGPIKDFNPEMEY